LGRSATAKKKSSMHNWQLSDTVLQTDWHNSVLVSPLIRGAADK